MVLSNIESLVANYAMFYVQFHFVGRVLAIMGYRHPQKTGGSRDGAVVRAISSHQCDPSSTPELPII